LSKPLPEIFTRVSRGIDRREISLVLLSIEIMEIESVLPGCSKSRASTPNNNIFILSPVSLVIGITNRMNDATIIVKTIIPKICHFFMI